ncbi:MAG: ankyrin repeat domain-containing protein [Bacillota bacterium]|jgi:ankyrin repeat protein
MTRKNKIKIITIICVVIFGAFLVAGCSTYENFFMGTPVMNKDERMARKIILAMQDDKEERAKELLQNNNSDLNVESFIFFDHRSIADYITPLQAACCFGDYEIVQMMVERGADVNLVLDWNSESPLMYAVMSDSLKYVEIIEFLLAKGADANYNNSVDQDALYNVIFTWDNPTNVFKIIDLLEQAGVDIYKEYEDKEYEDYGNILHMICWLEGADNSKSQDRLEIIKFLVEEKGFDVNVQKRDTGATPLIVLSLDADCEPIVEYLLAQGADKGLKDHAGKTKYDYLVEGLEDGSVKYENPERLLEMLKP